MIFEKEVDKLINSDKKNSTNTKWTVSDGKKYKLSEFEASPNVSFVNSSFISKAIFFVYFHLIKTWNRIQGRVPFG